MLNPIKFFSKFIRSNNQKELDKIDRIVLKVNSLEKEISGLSLKIILITESQPFTVLSISTPLLLIELYKLPFIFIESPLQIKVSRIKL